MKTPASQFMDAFTALAVVVAAVGGFLFLCWVARAIYLLGIA